MVDVTRAHDSQSLTFTPPRIRAYEGSATQPNSKVSNPPTVGGHHTSGGTSSRYLSKMEALLLPGNPECSEPGISTGVLVENHTLDACNSPPGPLLLGQSRINAHFFEHTADNNITTFGTVDNDDHGKPEEETNEDEWKGWQDLFNLPPSAFPVPICNSDGSRCSSSSPMSSTIIEEKNYLKSAGSDVTGSGTGTGLDALYDGHDGVRDDGEDGFDELEDIADGEGDGYGLGFEDGDGVLGGVPVNLEELMGDLSDYVSDFTTPAAPQHPNSQETPTPYGGGEKKQQHGTLESGISKKKWRGSKQKKYREKVRSGAEGGGAGLGDEARKDGKELGANDTTRGSTRATDDSGGHHHN